MDARDIDAVVEMRLAQAHRDGEFEGLENAKRHLDIVDGPYEEGWWIKRYIAREQLDVVGAVNPTLGLRKEAETLRERASELSSEAEVRDLFEDYNERVLKDRLRPVEGPFSPPIAKTFDVDEELTIWRRLSPPPESVSALDVSENLGSSKVPLWRRWFLGR